MFRFVATDTVSEELWPEPQWIVDFIPVAVPDLDFWESGTILLSIDGEDVGLQFPDSFEYRVADIRFVPEPGTGALVFVGLAIGCGWKERLRRRHTT